MNLRICDHLIYGFHRGLALTGKIRVPSLDQIRSRGFQRILIVATTAIGDAILCTPLIKSLRAAHPKVHIGFWVKEAAMPLFKNQAALDEILPYYGKYCRIGHTFHLLKKGHYDLALVANANDPDVIPLIWWSGCRRIIRRPQRNTIYPFMIANPEMLSQSHTTGHAIERNLQFCDLLGFPRGEAKTNLRVSTETSARVCDFLKGKQTPWWMIHPGASRSKKQWGAKNYAELTKRILGKQSGTVILTGDLREKDICDEIETQIGMSDRMENLAGKLQLDELAALLKNARLFISGDTGPYHIAMAVGTATVTLFAPWDIGSSSSINGPYFNQDRHRVVETAQMGNPISSIRVEQVFKEYELLSAIH